MYYWLVIAFLIVFSQFGSFNFTRESSDFLDYPNLDNLPELNEGDLIFRRGISTESYAVLAIDGRTRYSHVGIIHKDKNGKSGVMHIEPGDTPIENTIRFEPIAHFWAKSRASCGSIFRANMTIQQKQGLSRYLGKAYLKHVEFDDGYDLYDTSKIYCTELLYHAFNAGGVDLTNGHIDTLLFPKKKPIIFPSTILNSRELQTIFIFKSN